jgi:hypothetical protein
MEWRDVRDDTLAILLAFAVYHLASRELRTRSAQQRYLRGADLSTPPASPAFSIIRNN